MDPVTIVSSVTSDVIWKALKVTGVFKGLNHVHLAAMVILTVKLAVFVFILIKTMQHEV